MASVASAGSPGDPLDSTLLDGRYLVQAKIASGGTSTVYRGLDTRLDRPVALKVMDSRYAGDQQFLTRFQLEARSVARLRSTIGRLPAICWNRKIARLTCSDTRTWRTLIGLGRYGQGLAGVSP